MQADRDLTWHYLAVLVAKSDLGPTLHKVGVFHTIQVEEC